MDITCSKYESRSWGGKSRCTRFEYVCNICGRGESFTVKGDNSIVIMDAWEEISERAINHHDKEHQADADGGSAVRLAI